MYTKQINSLSINFCIVDKCRVLRVTAFGIQAFLIIHRMIWKGLRCQVSGVWNVFSET